MKGCHIFLVENSPLFQTALTSVLRRLGFSVTNLNPTGPMPKPAGETNVILVNVATFAQNQKELEELVKMSSGMAPVLLLARQDRVEELITAVKAGATGFINQTASAKDLRKAIVALAGGRTWCDRELFDRIVKFLPVLSGPRQVRLTRREEDVLKSLSLGRTNKEIAQHLSVSEQSIKVYVSNLLRKIGAANRSNLALYAVAQGYVETSPNSPDRNAPGKL